MSDLKTVLINDSRIDDISGELKFAVRGQVNQSTYQPASATTFNNSSHSWNINFPSENIVADRRVLIDSEVTFTGTFSGFAVGQVVFNYGVTDSLAPYPLNSLYLTQQASINNCSITVNTQDVMAPLLRMSDQKVHSKYDGFTPSLVDDTFGLYSNTYDPLTGAIASNSPLASAINNGYDNKLRPRGSYPVSVVAYRQPIGGGLPILIPAGNPIAPTVATDIIYVYVTVRLTEPLLLLSPFLADMESNNMAGFLGINNLSLQFTVDQTLKRVWRRAVNVAGSSVVWSLGSAGDSGVPTSANAFYNLRVLLNYLSVQPSQYAKISARNILPLLTYDRYLPNSGTISAFTATVGSVVDITSSNISLNQVPDLFIIVARRPMATQTIYMTDSFYKINSISLNFNNVSGILSGITMPQLYALSQKNGSSQSYEEFSGYMNANSTSGSGQRIPTIGSMVVLSGYDLNLPEYLSSSSLGSYNLQFSVQYENQFGAQGAGSPELVVITVNSGYMTTHVGSTQTFSGILNKEMVMSAKAGANVPNLGQSDYNRLVGGALSNLGTANYRTFLPRRMIMGNPRIMETPMMGSAMSAGVMSAGRLDKYIR